MLLLSITLFSMKLYLSCQDQDISMTQEICIPGRHINSSLKSPKMEGSCNEGGLNEMNKKLRGMPHNQDQLMP